MKSRWRELFYNRVMPQLPKKWMSHAVGSVAHWPIPEPLGQRMLESFVGHYDIDLEEAERPLTEYKSLGEFFSRRLKEGARPIESDVVHPCDGRLIESGEIHDGLLIQAKGKFFTLDELVPENPWSGDFSGGSFMTYYLAPHNYHRVHMPVSGEVCWSTAVPGELWPVNSWSVGHVEKLYAINERVVAGIQGEKGKVLMVMVGATNVGSISVTFDPNITTNRPGKKERIHRQYSEGRPLGVGEEFGTFHLGSTVILIYDKDWGLGHQPDALVKMGEALSP